MTTRLKAALARRWKAVRSVRGPGDALAHLRLAVLAFAITILLRLRLSKPLFKWLRSVKPRPTPATEAELQTIVRRTDTVLLLGRPLIRAECISRSCVLYYQFKRAGADVDIRFGVLMDGKKFRAHCWVLVDGEPKYEKFDPRGIYQGVFNLLDRKAS